jgi:hypothetical protein
MRAQPVLQAAKHLPLVLEGSRIRDVNFECKEADGHEQAIQQLAEKLRHEASGIKTPEEIERRTAGLKPRPSTFQTGGC